jgi:hypothetical protein
MGVYFGAEGDGIGTNDENPQGFWERQDIRDLNDYLLHSAGNDWDKLSGFILSALDDECVQHFEQSATELVNKLDQNTNWFAKEPRICVLMDAWKMVLSSPIYIHIYRNPIEVASSLYQRNGISIPEGVALWEKYNIDALNGAQHANRILVSHARLLTDPVKEVFSLFEKLTSLGVEDLKKPTEGEIATLVDTGLYRQRYDKSDLESYLNLQQLTLFNKFEDGTIFDAENTFILSKGASLVLDNYQTKSNYISQIESKIRELQLQQKELFTVAETLSQHFEAIFESSRWKLGDKLVSTLNVLKGQKGRKATVLSWVNESNRNLAKLEDKINKMG